MNTNPNDSLAKTSTATLSTYVADISTLLAEHVAAKNELVADGQKTNLANLIMNDLRADLAEMFSEMLVEAGCAESDANAAAAILMGS